MGIESIRRLTRFGPGPFVRVTLTGLGFVAIPLTAWLHVLSSLASGFAVFYLPAVALAARFGGMIAGILAAGAASMASAVAQHLVAGGERGVPISLGVAVAEFFVFAAVAYLIGNLGKARRRIHELERCDPLTGAATVGEFHDAAWREVLRAQRYGRPITVAFMDIDGFDKVNKAHGRAFGDELLTSIAAKLKEGLRTSDTLARVGGDEFALILPETPASASRDVLERLRGAVRDVGGAVGPITVGIGAATFMVPPEDLDDMLSKANVLLKRAKESGPNGTEQVTFQGTTLSKTSDIAMPERQTATSQERIEAAKAELRRLLAAGKQDGAVPPKATPPKAAPPKAAPSKAVPPKSVPPKTDARS
jgi:diguanylate cyclase (GGDEF)-like protein